MTTLTIYIIGLILSGILGYRVGLHKKQRDWERLPIQYVVGKESTVHVDNRGAITQVTVQNKRLTKVTYLK